LGHSSDSVPKLVSKSEINNRNQKLKDGFHSEGSDWTFATRARSETIGPRLFNFRTGGERQTGSGRELASTVNGTHAGDVFSSKAREIFVAEPESKSRRILIQQIRGARTRSANARRGGRRKVAIIAEADRLQRRRRTRF